MAGTKRQSAAKRAGSKVSQPRLTAQEVAAQAEAREALERALTLFMQLARSTRGEHFISVSGVLEVLVHAVQKPIDTAKAMNRLRSMADRMIRGTPTDVWDGLIRGSGTPLRGAGRAAAARGLLAAVKEYRRELPDKAEEVCRHLVEMIWINALGAIETG